MHGTCSMKWQTEGNACCWQRLSLPQPPCSPACPLCAEGVAVPLFALPRSSSTVLWSCAEGVAAACVRRCLINAQPAQLGSFCGCHGIGRRAPAANRQQNFILLIPCGALLVQVLCCLHGVGLFGNRFSQSSFIDSILDFLHVLPPLAY